MECGLPQGGAGGAGGSAADSEHCRRGSGKAPRHRAGKERSGEEIRDPNRGGGGVREAQMSGIGCDSAGLQTVCQRVEGAYREA